MKPLEASFRGAATPDALTSPVLMLSVLSDDVAELPSVPEPTEVEIELTNACNASCTACPRNNLTAPRGVIDEHLFRSIIDSYESYRTELAINRLRGGLDYPFVTLAGLGEPLLHPKALDLIEYSAARLPTIMFTNISRLDREKAHRLAKSGIRDVYVSFWGIFKEEYEAAMKIPFETSLANLEYFAPLAKENGVRLFVTWVQVPELQSTREEMSAFWKSKGIRLDTEDDAPENRSASNSVWNRGGEVTDIPQAALHSAVHFDKEFWCSQLYFADTICWDGDVLLCSQDYFRKQRVIGNVKTHSPREIGMIKQAIFPQTPRPTICVRCRKQRDYALATHPWDALLPPDQLRRYRYDAV